VRDIPRRPGLFALDPGRGTACRRLRNGIACAGDRRGRLCLRDREEAMIVLKNLLVATDFSEPSATALAYGRDLARAYGATLHVLHVTENLLMRYSPEISFAVPDLQADLDRQARQELDKAITADDMRTLKIVLALETGANPATTIVDYARTYDIDLIVVGTHGRGPVQHLIMGSVAERVVRTAPCPVLAVRAHEREFIAPDPRTASAQVC
jgi:nucleotide-binding universal stress UspA family protein